MTYTIAHTDIVLTLERPIRQSHSPIVVCQAMSGLSCVSDLSRLSRKPFLNWRKQAKALIEQVSNQSPVARRTSPRAFAQSLENNTLNTGGFKPRRVFRNAAKTTIGVAMSGGVDSSTEAAILARGEDMGHAPGAFTGMNTLTTSSMIHCS
ncbi:MAG TPA: hypothetical protein VG225_08005 [Terracidiphilus sp.]|jgi:asparagine synthetase B (glutamine-hydrolysing)|nr:hypothetical protein [Terracidiphilus sp.]